MILYLSCFQNFLTLASCSVYQHLKSLFLDVTRNFAFFLWSLISSLQKHRWLKRWPYNICLSTKLLIPVYTSLSIFNLGGLSILCVTKQLTKCKFLPIAVLIRWVFLKLNKYITQQDRLFSLWPCCCNLGTDTIFFSWWRKQHLFSVSCSFPSSDNAFRCPIWIPSEEIEN